MKKNSKAEEFDELLAELEALNARVDALKKSRREKEDAREKMRRAERIAELKAVNKANAEAMKVRELSFIDDFFNDMNKMLNVFPTASGKKDEVNHPEHYQGKTECIDAMRKEFGKDALYHFCLLNAFKYLYRMDKKGCIEKDAEKAKWYISKCNSLSNGDALTVTSLLRTVRKYK